MVAAVIVQASSHCQVWQRLRPPAAVAGGVNASAEVDWRAVELPWAPHAAERSERVISAAGVAQVAKAPQAPTRIDLRLKCLLRACFWPQVCCGACFNIILLRSFFFLVAFWKYAEKSSKKG